MAIFVNDIKMRYRTVEGRDRQMQGCVPIFDEDLQSVPGVLVRVRWINPVGRAWVQSAVTRANGAAYFTLDAPTDGTYTLTVEGVRVKGYEYDPDLNLEVSRHLDVF